MNSEKFKELCKAAKPLVEYMRKYHNPHQAAIVRLDRIEIVSEECGLQLEVPD